MHQRRKTDPVCLFGKTDDSLQNYFEETIFCIYQQKNRTHWMIKWRNDLRRGELQMFLLGRTFWKTQYGWNWEERICLQATNPAQQSISVNISREIVSFHSDTQVRMWDTLILSLAPWSFSAPNTDTFERNLWTVLWLWWERQTITERKAPACTVFQASRTKWRIHPGLFVHQTQLWWKPKIVPGPKSCFDSCACQFEILAERNGVFAWDSKRVSWRNQYQPNTTMGLFLQLEMCFDRLDEKLSLLKLTPQAMQARI